MSTYLTAETVRTHLAAVALHASDDTTRPHMCGVLIERKVGATRYVATNGHTLAAYSGEGLSYVSATSGQYQPDESFLLPTSLVKELITHAKKNKLASYTVTPSSVESQGTVWSYANHASDFPPYHQVVPAAPSKPGVFAIAFKYATLAAKSFELATPKGSHPSFAMVSAGDSEPILCASESVRGLLVVVMPVRMGVTPAVFAMREPVRTALKVAS